MSRRGTVYLIAQPTISRTKPNMNLDALYKHGDVVVLVTPGEYPAFNAERVFQLITDRLAKYNPATDYIAWGGGETLAALMAGMVLAQQGHRAIRWLRYDRGRDPKTGERTDHDAKYVPIDVPLLTDGTVTAATPSHDGAPHADED